MTIVTLFADIAVDPRVPHLQLILPLAAGVVAGLGVVGALHFLIRPRAVVAAPAKPQQVCEDPFVHGSPTDQRKSFRRQGNPVQILIAILDTKTPPLKGYVVDRSLGGLAILAEQPIAGETKLTVRPVNAPPLVPWIEMTVKSCRQANPGFELGCQFVKTPPWALLLMFG